MESISVLATGKGHTEKLFPWVEKSSSKPRDQTVKELLLSGSFGSMSAKMKVSSSKLRMGHHTQSTPNSTQSIHGEVAEGQVDLGTWAVVFLSIRKRTGRCCQTSGGSSVLPEELGSTIYTPQLKLSLTSHLSTTVTRR